MSFFPRFAGSDVLIQCMSTTTHSLSNQTFYWSSVALEIPNALSDECQRCFYTVLNSRPFAVKPASIPLHHGGYNSLHIRYRTCKSGGTVIALKRFAYRSVIAFCFSICDHKVMPRNCFEAARTTADQCAVLLQ